MPPECFKVLSNRIAPKIIHKIPAVTTSPCRVEARTRLKLISQKNNAIVAVMAKTNGIACLAGQRKPISKIAASKIGAKANKANTLDGIMRLLELLCATYQVEKHTAYI